MSCLAGPVSYLCNVYRCGVQPLPLHLVSNLTTPMHRVSYACRAGSFAWNQEFEHASGAVGYPRRGTCARFAIASSRPEAGCATGDRNPPGRRLTIRRLCSCSGLHRGRPVRSMWRCRRWNASPPPAELGRGAPRIGPCAGRVRPPRCGYRCATARGCPQAGSARCVARARDQLTALGDTEGADARPRPPHQASNRVPAADGRRLALCENQLPGPSACCAST